MRSSLYPIQLQLGLHSAAPSPCYDGLSGLVCRQPLSHFQASLHLTGTEAGQEIELAGSPLPSSAEQPSSLLCYHTQTGMGSLFPESKVGKWDKSPTLHWWYSLFFDLPSHPMDSPERQHRNTLFLSLSLLLSVFFPWPPLFFHYSPRPTKRQCFLDHMLLLLYTSLTILDTA